MPDDRPYSSTTSPNSTLSVRLESKEVYRAGDAIPIKFTMVNSSDRPVRILTWYTPLEGLRGKIFKITREGEEIPYTGPMVKRGNPHLEDYVLILPKDSVRATVDFCTGYILVKDGNYLVELKRREYDVIQEETEFTRIEGAHSNLEIASNPVSFMIIRA
jgi:hypothetical protein